MTQPGRLLVVDGDPGMAGAFRVWASRMDCEVKIVQRWTEASEVCAAFEPGVILLDLAILRTGGAEILKQLAATEPQARLIVMSGEDEGVLQKAAEEGRAQGLEVLGTFEKPLDFDALTRLLRLTFDTGSRN